jgi:rhamnogalacturonyl hydrolase YesR
MWDEETGVHSPCFWGRGNGWVAMSYVEVLKNTPEGAPERPRLVDGYRKLLGALVARQDRQSGLWHTVLDDPSSYGETSATAMIAYSMIEGRRLHLLDVGYDEPIQRAWAALSTQVNNMGQAHGVSGGTGPGDRESYLARPLGVYPWGSGAMLMAAAAMAEAERGK